MGECECDGEGACEVEEECEVEGEMRESVRLRVSVIPIVILTLTLKHNIRTLSVGIRLVGVPPGNIKAGVPH